MCTLATIKFVRGINKYALYVNLIDYDYVAEIKFIDFFDSPEEAMHYYYCNCCVFNG